MGVVLGPGVAAVGTEVVPVVAPVKLGATRAWEAGLGSATSDGWPWVALLALFAALYTSIGVLSCGPLLEGA